MAQPYEYRHGGLTRPEVVRARYRLWSRQGQTRGWMLNNIRLHDGTIDAEELYWMDQHVDQMFWQMVRKLYRDNPGWARMLEFIENFYEVPQHEMLERIKRQYWSFMQVWSDDRQHTGLWQKIHELYQSARDQLVGAVATPENAAELRRQRDQQIRLNERRLRRQAQTGEYQPPVPQPWELDEEDELIPDRQQVYDREDW